MICSQTSLILALCLLTNSLIAPFKLQRRNSDSTQNVFGEDNESKSQASSLDSEEPAKGRFMVSWNRKKWTNVLVQKIILTYIALHRDRVLR